MNNKQFNVLFLCTGNSARSIMAEALLTRWGPGKFNSYSAGSDPKDQVNPKTIEILEKNNFITENYRSKSWDEYTDGDAPEMDFVITVCSNAANENCPLFPGNYITAHWDIADPAGEYDSEDKEDREFRRAFLELEQRIKIFTNLPIEKLDRMALQEKMQEMSD